MVDSVQKLIAAYQQRLSGEELNKFNSLPQDKQLAIAMVQIQKAAPVDTGALKALEESPPKEGAKPTNIFPTDTFASKDYKMGLYIESSGKKEAPPAPETPAKPEEPATPKTTAHVVQVGERIQDLVKKSLEAQGKTVDVNSEEFKKAKAEFIANNNGAFGKDNKFMFAGKSVNLTGEVHFEHEKTAQEVEKEYKNMFAKKPVAKSHATVKPTTAKHEDKSAAAPNPEVKKPVAKSPAAVKPTTAKHEAKSPASSTTESQNLQNMTQAEIAKFRTKHKIQPTKGETYQKNTKTGEVVNSYNNDGKKYINTYDNKGNCTKQIERQKDGTVRTYTGDDGHGHWTKEVKQEKDGTITTYTGSDGHDHWTKAVTQKKDGTITTYTGSDEHGGWTKKVKQEKDGTVTTYTGDDGHGNWAKKVTQKKEGTVIIESNPDKNGHFQSKKVVKAGGTQQKTNQNITQAEKNTIAESLKDYQYSRGASINKDFRKLSQDVVSQLYKKFNNNPVQVAIYINQISGGNCKLANGTIISNMISNNPQDSENFLIKTVTSLAKNMIK